MTAQTALVLAGHGSHISPLTAGLVWRYVDVLRARGIADEITACFWKEQPSFHEVLASIQADDITVVPVFTAQGYFTRSVIPAEMALNGHETQRNGRMIRYGATLGEHHDLQGIVLEHVRTMLALHELDPMQTSVVIVGHGTKRSQHSQQATRDQVRMLSQRGIVRQVLDAYLDDDPDITSIYQRVRYDDVIVVPFFLAPGSHVTIDVPDALGLSQGATTGFLHGKHIYYTDPIGTNDVAYRIIIDLAYEAGLPEKITPSQSLWDGCPRAGADALIRAVEAAPDGVRFGDLLLTRDTVRPADAAAMPVTIDSPGALRAYLRENPFRPLASRRDLPADWQVKIAQIAHLPAVVETVYPGAVAQWARQDAPVKPFASAIDRQQGNYRQLTDLSAEAIQTVVNKVCGQCVKSPAWHDPAQGGIRCGDPCNVWLSAAMESRFEEETV